MTRFLREAPEEAIEAIAHRVLELQEANQARQEAEGV